LSLEEVEIIQIDRRYEGYRMRSHHREGLLLSSIAQRGVDEPITGSSGVNNNGHYVLMDGFKRLRCAEKLGYKKIKFAVIAEDEAASILYLIKSSNEKGLTMLEQAKLVDELHRVFKMNVREISQSLMRSSAWVSVRLQVLKDMSKLAIDKILSGEFPLYSYLYTLRSFRRLNKKEEVDNFIKAVSGKKISTREIDFLAKNYFNGDEQIRSEITSGNIQWLLDKAKEEDHGHQSNLGNEEQMVIRDLEIISKIMGRLVYRLRRKEFLKSNEFHAQAELLAGGTIKKIEEFSKSIKEFYDGCRERKVN
jgi:ParB/RepB/Spo0J family partition protein